MTTPELADRAAIHDVLLHYARGVDEKDLARVAACFTSDASYEGTLARGRIGDALAALGQAMARYESTLHLLGSPLIEIAGDQARSEVYAVAYHQLRDGGQLTTAVMYQDDLVRRGERWLIRHRTVRLAWQRPDGAPRPAV
jgi:3-phenylpropionate/cinnamic acid dioxygenase small subunit